MFGNSLCQRLFSLVPFIHRVTPYRNFGFLVNQTNAGRFDALYASAVQKEAPGYLTACAFSLVLYWSRFEKIVSLVGVSNNCYRNMLLGECGREVSLKPVLWCQINLGFRVRDRVRNWRDVQKQKKQ